MTQFCNLAAKRILVVEDELYIGLDVTDVLFRAGAQTLGPVTDYGSAVEICEMHRVDAAILDFNIAGTKITPLAKHLFAIGVPFIVSTGNRAAALASGIGAWGRVFEKPMSVDQLLVALDQLVLASASPALSDNTAV